MDLQHQRWEKYYTEQKSRSHDDWLKNHADYFQPGMHILDLGCGNGSNIEYLLSQSGNIYVCDYSETAIRQIKIKYPVTAIIADMREELPYRDKVFDIVISDLSLHYFSEDETKIIMHELIRIMKRRGFLIGRVNSTHDINHGAGKGIEIERNYYDNKGEKKRFFDKEMILELFGGGFDILQMKENWTNKYADTKVVWEFVLRSPA